MNDGWSFATGIVLVAPMNEREDRGRQLEAHFRQAIFVSWRRILIGNTGQDVLSDQQSQPFAQNAACDFQAPLEFLEPPHAEEAVAKYKQRPAVAHDGERTGERAVFLGEVLPAHRVIVSLT